MEVSVMTDKKRFERDKQVVGENYNSESFMTKKAQAIAESKMPEAQKIACLKEIGAIPEETLEGKVSFGVYAKVKKVEVSRHLAMKAYPKAKQVRLATLEEWDEIFKEF